MILRRIKKHVQNENWFAIGIDFLIVVFGVFLGIQIGDWNDSRQENQSYENAKSRLNSEIQTNLKSLDHLDKEVNNYLTVVSTAFDTLLSCEDSKNNQAIVNRGITAITGSYGISLRSSALQEMTSSESLLSRQSVGEREQLARTKYYMDLVIREASYAEILPLNERAQNNPIIGLGIVAQRDGTYTGVDLSRQQRALELNTPIGIACKNDQLLKSFYTWERWQGVLPALSRVIRKELLVTQQILTKPNQKSD